MKFSQVVSALAVAVTVSGSVIARNEPTCGGISCCSSDEKTFTLCEKGSSCSSGSSPYCCTTFGFLNVLNCINLLDGNSVSIPITVSVPLSA